MMKRGVRKMEKRFSAIASFALTLIFLGSANAGEWIEQDTYLAPMASITVDGDPSDWAGIETLTDVEFRTTADEWVVFEEYDGGVWNGPDDHSTSVAFAWDAEAIYVYIMVVDDEHEHQSASFWDGDAVQLVFADAARTAHTHLYNYALSHAQDAIILGNEMISGDGMTEADVAIVRDDSAGTTFYEARFVPEILDLASLEAGMSIGIGVCVNDGDLDTPGQKGWGGWGPHAAVFGKNGDKTGLVTLSALTPAAVEFSSRLTTTWGGIKK
jgi:hypothetical protein